MRSERISQITRPDEASRTQVRWFVTVWVMAFTVHYFEQRPFDGLPLIAAAIVCLIVPGSLAAFVLFLAVSSWAVFVHLPAASNHLVLGGLINLAFAASAVAVWRSRRKDRTSRGGATFSERWFDVVRTPALLVLLVVYFFGVFHKLNTSFFDSEVSCAGALASNLLLLQGLGSGGVPQSFVAIAALLTVLGEGVILVCLAVPRLRRWGVLIGVVFHSMLAVAQFYDFSTFVFALYILILAPEAAMRIARPERNRRWAMAGWVALGGVSIAAYLSAEPTSPMGLRWHTLQVATWFMAMLPLVVPMLRESFSRGGNAPAPQRWSLRPAWLLLVPALAFLNGITPYIGVKTVGNYSMFSNLRTEEGETNHYLSAVRSLEITDLLHDTVDVYSISLPDADRLHFGVRRPTRWAGEPRPVRVPWIELRRAVLLWKDAGIENVHLRYVHDGVERDVDYAEDDPELTEPLPFGARRLLAFRAIELDDAVSCRW